MTTAVAYEPYKGEVARIREQMERERAAEALAGIRPAGFESCAVSRKVLRAALCTSPPPFMTIGKRPIRPWRLGTSMITTSPFLWEGLARVVNDREVEGWVEVWTRKSHRAWRKQTMSAARIVGGILRGEIKDAW